MQSEETNWDDFGDDVFAVAEVLPAKSNSEVQDTANGSSKIMVSTDLTGLGRG